MPSGHSNPNAEAGPPGRWSAGQRDFQTYRSRGYTSECEIIEGDLMGREFPELDLYFQLWRSTGQSVLGKQLRSTWTTLDPLSSMKLLQAVATSSTFNRSTCSSFSRLVNGLAEDLVRARVGSKCHRPL